MLPPGTKGYWLEFKYGLGNNPFIQYFSHNVQVNNNTAKLQQTIDGWAGMKYMPVGTDDKFTVTITLTPQSNAIYNNEEVDLSNGNIIHMTVGCWRRYADASSIVRLDDFSKSGDNQSIRKIGLIDIYFSSTNPVILNKTCSLSSARNQTISLQPVTIGQLNNNTEVSGKKTFTISLNCSQAAVRDAYISFTDGTKQDNSSDALTIQTGEGQATGVKLKIYQEGSSTAIKYGPASTSQFAFTTDSNMREFADNVTGQPNVSKTYTVKYYKTGTTVTPGSVNARLIYNLYYR